MDGSQILSTSVIIGVVVVAGLIMVNISNTTYSSATIELGKYASGVLTFSGNASDGELVNISTYTFELDDDNSFTAGHIQVNVSNQTDGSIDPSIAIANLTNAVNANASVAALVQAVAT